MATLFCMTETYIAYLACYVCEFIMKFIMFADLL